MHTTEEKAKVVAAVWRTDLIQYLAALAVLHRDYVNKRMNLIIGTEKHAEKDLIYSVLYKRLEIAEIKELPMLIYNTSLDPKKYESILDVLIENKALKLAQLIVSIAIKQDQIGYIYSRLYQYL